ncbi:MAG: bifunctional serine/threonine-protein kinase/ABC transporter substrate-binding protein, partial [Kofleriaceae bacterium]
MSVAAARDPLGWVGTLLERKYRVDARVAEGGFGVVYRGQHIGLARPLAIKFLKQVADASADEWTELVAQFLEEARLIAKLCHPAVVNVIDAGVTATDANPEGVPWIAMEWLRGETLAEELAGRRARGDRERSRAEVFELLRPVVEAMAEAHEAGIVHRDLNPNNVMLVPGNPAVSARILDFGVAKIMKAEPPTASSRTATGTAVRACSLAYAAPEQLSGARTGPWTDVHALGLLCTELLCGRRAIAQDDVDAYYCAAFDPMRPTPAGQGVDAGDWEPILARALALHPHDRYASARELLVALDTSDPTALPSGSSARRDPAEGGSAARQVLAGAPAAREVRTGAFRALALTAAFVVLLAVTWVGQHRFRGRAAAGAPAAATCTSNAACSRPGAPAICRPEVGCVALRSPDCEPFADARAFASADTVWFGTLLPRSGPDAAAFGERETQAVELARRDFAQLMSNATGTLERARPFGLIACDDAVDPRRAAHHLVDTIGVPAVVGFYSSLEAIDLTTSLFLPRRVLAIASLNTNPLVTAVPQVAGAPRLVWRTTYSSADAARALSAFVAGELEPALRGGPRPR